jgi:hypothetical protein
MAINVITTSMTPRNDKNGRPAPGHSAEGPSAPLSLRSGHW